MTACVNCIYLCADSDKLSIVLYFHEFQCHQNIDQGGLCENTHGMVQILNDSFARDWIFDQKLNCRSNQDCCLVFC